MHIKLSYENIEMLKAQHKKMMTWHKSIAEQSASAAMWHKSKIQDFEKMLADNMIDEEQHASSIDEEIMNSYDRTEKISDLIQILQDHVSEYGQMNKTIDEIISFLESE
jgi:hypothetical protein